MVLGKILAVFFGSCAILLFLLGAISILIPFWQFSFVLFLLCLLCFIAAGLLWGAL